MSLFFLVFFMIITATLGVTTARQFVDALNEGERK